MLIPYHNNKTEGKTAHGMGVKNKDSRTNF